MSTCPLHPTSPSKFGHAAAVAFTCLALVASLVGRPHAQTPASCNFSVFNLVFDAGNGLTATLSTNGINDYRTVVGAADFTNAFGESVSTNGFVRWSNGSYDYLSKVILVDRNDNGTSIGYLMGSSSQVLMNGTTITPIALRVGTKQYTEFTALGINNWGSIVGSYSDAAGASHGFKRWKGGGTVALDYPGASLTYPTRINDHGAIVGSYVLADLSIHGFYFYNGRWATLDYPNASATSLSGISNSGVIAGTALVSGSNTDTAFLYRDGKFETITLPKQGSGVSNSLKGISLRSGLILGLASSDSMVPPKGFIASCD